MKTNGHIKIEKGIAMPIRKGAGRPSKYPIADMGVGDSFAVPGSYKEANQLRQCFCQFSKRHHKGKWKNTVQIESETKTVRIWRTK